MSFRSTLILCILSLILHSNNGFNENGDDVTYGEWGECSRSCNNGTQQRTVYCNGEPCGYVTGYCNVKPCVNIYGHWLECDEPCGGGRMYSSRLPIWIDCNMQQCDNDLVNCKSDIVFVVDSSSSIGYLNWQRTKQFVISLVKGLKVEQKLTRIGYIHYSTMFKNDIELHGSQEIKVILEHVDTSIYMGGLTNTADALDSMRIMQVKNRRSKVQQIAILLTDGASNLNSKFTIPNARKAHEEDIKIFSIGIGNRTSEKELKAIASSPELHYHVASYEALQSIIRKILKTTCEMNVEKTICKKTEGVCEAKCDQSGNRKCNEKCFVYSVNSNDDYKLLRIYEKTCTGSECQGGPCSTPPTPNDDCHLCDFTKGQIWRPDVNNCHYFFVCEPLAVPQTYRRTRMSCGSLWWDQDIHTCVLTMPAYCKMDVDVPTTTTAPTTISTTPMQCPYDSDASAPRKFWLKTSRDLVQECPENFSFLTDVCTCIPDKNDCKNDMLLHFPFDKHFNDVTCKHAHSMPYGTPTLKYSSTRGSNVACFDGHSYLEVAFMRGYFAGDWVKEFTSSLWFKRDDFSTLDRKSTLINNKNCKQSAGFSLFSEKRASSGSLTTRRHAVLPLTSTSNGWHHVALVYDGSSLKFYLDGHMTKQENITGGIQNNDSPMRIADNCQEDRLIGCIDEIQIYSRALKSHEIIKLSQQ